MKSKPTHTRAERPKDLDYKAQIDKRFGSTSLIEMDAVGLYPSSERKPYQVAERVAIIQVYGALCNDPMWWDETGYDELQYEFNYAANDPDVDGILQVISSPGGETDMAFETADLVAEVGKKKPIWSVAAPFAYSAAYLLASQSKRIYVPPITGGVGSIGVYCVHFDYSDMLKQAGVKVTVISAGEGKAAGNRYQPLSAEAMKDIKSEVDRLYSEFVSRVSSGRKLAESAIIKLGAWCYDGAQKSLGVGLADQAGSADTAWFDFATKLAASKENGGASASTDDSIRIGDSMKTDPTQNPGATAAPPPPAGAPPAGQTDPSQKPAAAAPPAGAAAATMTEEQITAAVDKARADGDSRTKRILGLCSLAGLPLDKTLAYVNDSKASVESVEEALIKERHAKSAEGGEIRGETQFHYASEATPAKKSTAERNREQLLREGVLTK